MSLQTHFKDCLYADFMSFFNDPSIIRVGLIDVMKRKGKKIVALQSTKKQTEVFCIAEPDICHQFYPRVNPDSKASQLGLIYRYVMVSAQEDGFVREKENIF